MAILVSHKKRYANLNLYAFERSLQDFVPLWLEKVRRSLALIKRTSPNTAARLYRDVKRILVWEIEGPAYLSRVDAIRLNGPSLLRQDASSLALTIVHEATHARIAGRGIKYTGTQRGRHERLCVKAEVNFARKLPDGETVAERLAEKLDDPWWTEDKIRERRNSTNSS